MDSQTRRDTFIEVLEQMRAHLDNGESNHNALIKTIRWMKSEAMKSEKDTIHMIMEVTHETK